MESSKRPSGQASARREGAAGLLEYRRRMTELETELLRSVQDAQRRAYEQWSAAFEQYAGRVQELFQEATTRQEEAYAGFVTRMADAGSGDSAQTEAANAYLDALRSGARAANESVSRWEQAVRELAEASSSSAELAAQETTAAYRQYLHGMQKEWSRVDVDAVVDAYALQAS